LTEKSARAPVFIVGQARSGSSILYRLLQEHPAFRPAGGLNLSESHMMTVVASEPSIDVLSMRSFAALDDAGWEAMTEELRSVERRRRAAVACPTGALLRSPALWSAVGCEATVRTFVAHAALARGAARLVEKTPQHLPWARHLLRTFPDARLLSICRHPLGAYASYRRRAAEDSNATWADVDVTTFAAAWRADVERIATLATTEPERFRIERYEELTADPERAQEGLFRWLGEDVPAALPVTVAPDPHAPSSEASQLYGTIRDLGRDWTTWVAAAEAAALEQALAAPMALLGYRPAA